MMKATASARVFMGDLNVDEDEAKGLCEKHGLCDAEYAQMSWCPKISQYFGRDHSYTGHGYRFDRVLFGGAAWANAFLVGHEWKYEGGVQFRLSDHFGVLAFLDVHMAYVRDVGELLDDGSVSPDMLVLVERNRLDATHSNKVVVHSDLRSMVLVPDDQRRKLFGSW